MVKYKDEIIAYANGKQLLCKYAGWDDWGQIEDMRNSALRALLGIDEDEGWSFKVEDATTD